MKTNPVGCGERSEPQHRDLAAADAVESVKDASSPRRAVFRHRIASTLRFALLTATCVLLSGCVETRFESPLGDNIESCDVNWKGLWLAEDAVTREHDDGALYVDEECRFHVLDQTERGAPLKPIHVPLNYVHDGGNDYLVVSDAQLKGLVKLPPPHAISPTPEKSFFFARYRVRGDRLEISEVDSERVAKLILDAKIEGTVDKSSNELHVFVRGNRRQMLEIVRAHAIFSDKPLHLRRTEQSVEAYEKDLLARQRKETK